MKTPRKRTFRIGVVGLGYVGLPLAVEFGKFFPTVGFDINERRIAELQAGKDSTLEVSKVELKGAAQLEYSASLAALKRCTFYIVTVPTPIDQYKRPDLTPLVKASETLGKVLKMDPKTQRFEGNAAANALLTRNYRAPFVVPENV